MSDEEKSAAGRKGAQALRDSLTEKEIFDNARKGGLERANKLSGDAYKSALERSNL